MRYFDGDLQDLMSEAADELQQYRDSIVEGHTVTGGDGRPDVATIEQSVREEVERLDDLVKRMREAV